MCKMGQSSLAVPDGCMGVFSNLVCFSLLTALEKTRDDENILDNFITFFFAGWYLTLGYVAWESVLIFGAVLQGHD